MLRRRRNRRKRKNVKFIKFVAKRKRGRSRFRGKAIHTNKKAVIPRGILPFPEKFVVTLKYCDQDKMNGDEGLLIGAARILRANSVYDPNQTAIAGDHQPRYYDEISAHYGQYRVISSKVTCKFIPLVLSEPMFCYIALSEIATPAETWIAACERKNYVTKLIPNNILAGNPIHTLSKTFSGRTFLNKAQNIKSYDTDDNPTVPAYFILGVFNLDGNSQPAQEFVALS